MLPEDQQRILGYFIEEARDHLHTIEQGLLNLQSTVDDGEMMNELFRAAHSVKGGAAMLNLHSIHRTSHRLEDFFKLLKDSGVRPDRELESMLLRAFDGLQEQVSRLQSPFGLSETQGQAMADSLEPIFNQTETHLNQLLKNSPDAAVAPAQPLPEAAVVRSSHPETSAMQLVFSSDVPRLLREMLGNFKGIDDSRSRQRLGQICKRLYSLGEQFDLLEWCALVDTVTQAVANPGHTYRSLAEVVIKNLKFSQDLVLQGRSQAIAPSTDLIALASSNLALSEESASAPQLVSELSAREISAMGQPWPLPVDRDGQAQVSLADLNSLADMFEFQQNVLDDLWREEHPEGSSTPPLAAPQPSALDQGGSFLDQDLMDWLNSETEHPSAELSPGETGAKLDSLSEILDDFTAAWMGNDLDLSVGAETGFQPELVELTPSLDAAIAPMDFKTAAVEGESSALQEFSGLEPESPLPILGTAVSADHDFEDLEKLLEEADQSGGLGTVPGGRRRSGTASQRLPRRSLAGMDQTMRVSVNHLDNLANLVGELVINRNSLEQDQDRLRQSLDKLLAQVQQLNDVGQRMRNLYERSLLESTLMTNRRPFDFPASGSSGGHAIGVTFDALEMDRFTDFHTLSQEMIELIVRVRESSSDIEITIDSTEQVTRQFRQVTTQLQEGLNKARMVPFGQTVNHLPRAIRDISLKCGREARLVVEGEDTLIDQMIVERLYDPLIHLVNNALTHGIETPEERLALGKPRQGTITIRAFYQGNQTVIYIADDGHGIDPATVRAKALEKGLITAAESQNLSTTEAYDLLFLPQFTTRDQADAFSGRGVGLDVVNTALTDIRGSITIESEIGRGTSFTIRLPLTLSITKALSCLNNQ
ncbi:MAG: ATP-binding protein, partial [Nodosilinea sp.]